MKKWIFMGLLVLITISGYSQSAPLVLTVEKIMRDPKWIGTSPSNPAWSADGNALYFNWNPEKADADSLYFITTTNHTPMKANRLQREMLVTDNEVNYNIARSAYVYSLDGDIFYTDVKNKTTRRITGTTDIESGPQFSFNERKIVYNRNGNLYAWDIQTGETMQLTNLIKGEGPKKKDSGTVAELWLRHDQLRYFEVLRSRKDKREKREAYNKLVAADNELHKIFISDKELSNLAVSPDGRFITYQLTTTRSDAKETTVPSYVTESGFTTDLPGRTKVGRPEAVPENYIYDRDRDTVWQLSMETIAGMRDLPDYLNDYPKEKEKRMKDSTLRTVFFSNPYWSPKGSHVIFDVLSFDYKDRWLVSFDTATRRLKLIDRQRDEAWVGGPGTAGLFANTNNGWLNENTFWFESEVTGYSHLYTADLNSGEKKTLTSGRYEVQQVSLSNDKKTFYLTTNEVHPGEKQFYRMPATGGKAEKITSMTGANNVTISPDEKSIAIVYSYSNKPWELFVQENKPGGKAEQVTNKAQSDEFKSYPWRDPAIITFKARDGADVYARIYKPANPDPHHCAVIFVHGAGYLQNAHKWWSYYYHEFMFNNMLTDKGYYVMDIDYRGSQGYGRNWRTAIYRYMGGKDLDDQLDAAGYLVKNCGVDPKKIGIYGGSYGGFITLMALFNHPGVFAAGAALRPVTDWANYNHEYTANILNEPENDSIAYRRSSPFYFAEGLQDHLLICHGMIDLNVHFQDAVKLTQRLIELGKDNWELAPYPLEDHGFVEPSSWTDEYKRIFKLFETVLRN